MKNKIISIFSVLFLSALTFILISSLAIFGNNTKFVLGILFYFLEAYFVLKFFNKLKQEGLIALIIMPPLLILLFVNITNFKEASISLPSNLSFILSTIIGFLFYKNKKIIYPFFLVLIISSWIFLGEKYYLNKINYGSFKKEVSIKLPHYNFFDSTKKNIILNSVHKKVIVDFWNSTCGACYKAFPFIDSVSKIIDTSKYEIYVVNIALPKEKFQNNFKLLNKYDYTFNQLFAINADFLDSINTNTYPTTVIIENEKIIYKGDFETAIKKW